MPKKIDQSLSLQDLEQDDWGEAPFDSHVVRSVHVLRRVPLHDLTIEQLRLLIGQGVGLSYLIPLALEQLTADPFVQGDFYPGDLLVAVLSKTPAPYWHDHDAERQQALAITTRAVALHTSRDDVPWHQIATTIEAAVERLRST
jgi:hypothetical protein